MDPITIVVGIVGGAAAVAVTRKKSSGKPAAGTALPMASAVPGTIGASYWDRYRTRSVPWAERRAQYSIPTSRVPSRQYNLPRTYQRAQTTPRAQAAPVATTTPVAVPSGGVRFGRTFQTTIRVNRRFNIFNGHLDREKLNNIVRYLQQNRSTGVTVTVQVIPTSESGIAPSTYEVTPQAFTNLRNLLRAAA